MYICNLSMFISLPTWNRQHKHTDLIPSFFNMWRFVVWRLIKVFKDSLGSSEKGNSCYMTLWKVCCVIKHDVAGFYKLWNAQRPYVIQTPLHNVLLDISFVKKKKREQMWELLHVSFLFQKAEVSLSAHRFGVILFSFPPSGVMAMKFFVSWWVRLQK